MRRPAGMTGVSICLTVAWMISLSHAQVPSLDQLISLKRAYTPVISPDGRRVAYVLGEADVDENAWDDEIWLTAVEEGRPFQLTSATGSSWNPAWSRDAERLAFLSDRGGSSQIYLISLRGGEAWQLTESETGVDSFAWSPDGLQVAFTMTDPESARDKARKEKYGQVLEVDANHRMTHLWVIETAKARIDKPVEARRVTEGQKFTIESFSWSPDSKSVVFSARRDPELASRDTADLYIVGIGDGAVRKLVESPGREESPVWSPDGVEVAYIVRDAEDYYYANGEIAVIPVKGGSPRILTRSFDEDPELLGWGPKGIYLGASQKTAAHLFRLNPSTGRHEYVSSPADDAYNREFSFTRDFRLAAFIRAEPNRFFDVHVTSLRSFAPRRLTALRDQVSEFPDVVREVISWKSTDGSIIEGILIKPGDFDPSKKYPLLVRIHGGPVGMDRPFRLIDRTYPLESFVAKGAVVLLPNYRGSMGYGGTFRALNVKNLGVGGSWDVISGVDHLIARGYVDEDRVGAMGWSYGGYLSAFVGLSSNRFKAVSVGAGISNWRTYYIGTDIREYVRQYLEATPWDDPEIYAKTAPVTYIKKAKTPVLIQHGWLDRRVPVSNALELYQALRDHGVPVKMFVLPDSGHGINSPRQIRAVMKQNYDWFSQWIWGEEPEEEFEETGQED